MTGPSFRRSLPAACAGVMAAAVCLSVVGAFAAGGAAALRTFESPPYHYSVAFPEGCRYEEGPGTVDAVCDDRFDADRSARAATASALVMQVGAETLRANGQPGSSDAAHGYNEAAFREELPQAVCSETDPARARIEKAGQTRQENLVIYTADVICSEVRFLQIAERRAAVRYLVGPESRYRLIARAPIASFEKNQQAITAFFDSFRILPAGDKRQ